MWRDHSLLKNSINLFHSNHQNKGYALTILAAFSGSIFFIAYKKGLQTMTPEVYTMAVYITGFFFHFLGQAVKKDKMTFNRATLLGAFIFALLSVIGNFAIGKALEGVSPSIAAVIMRSQIILVMFLGWLVFKEKLNRWLVPGAFVSILGFIWMNYSEEAQSSGEIQYYLWGLCAAATFGITQVLVKGLIHKINPITMNQFRLLFGILIIAFYPGVLSAMLQLNTFEWTLAAVSSLFGPSLARVLQMYALRYIPVSEAILFSMLSPVFALILAWILLDIFPRNQQMLGAGMILLGIVIPSSSMVWEQKKKR